MSLTRYAPLKYVRQYARLTASMAAVLLWLSGCYFPASFNADIELSRNGFYKMTFDGYVVDLGLYDQLARGELKPDTKDTRERIQATLTDFQRDSATKEISYYGQGAFKVLWTRSGDMVKSKFVTFVRRNEKMLSITYDPKDYTMTVRGTVLGAADRERLTNMGVGMQGVLRVQTDAPVVSHNATNTVAKGDVKIYEWTIQSVNDPAPQMVVRLR